MLTSKVLSRLLLAIGQPGRTVRIALVTTPVVVAGYAVGLPGGPNGVAAGFSVATFLLAAPVILWAIRGTIITGSDMLKVVLVPSLSVITAAAATLASWTFINLSDQPLVRLTCGSAVFFGIDAFLLLFVFGQKDFYLSLLREMRILAPTKGYRKQEAWQHADA